MKTIKLLSILFISSLVFISCSDDDDPIPVNEEEVITTMTATLTPTGGGTAIVLKTQDLDGDGPNAPVITVSNSLAINTVYTGVMEVLNETETPAEDITEEVLEEARKLEENSVGLPAERERVYNTLEQQRKSWIRNLGKRLTPDEFNRTAAQVQLEIFNEYFESSNFCWFPFVDLLDVSQISNYKTRIEFLKARIEDSYNYKASQIIARTAIFYKIRSASVLNG